jgi:hypothetical protein
LLKPLSPLSFELASSGLSGKEASLPEPAKDIRDHRALGEAADGPAHHQGFRRGRTLTPSV